MPVPGKPFGPIAFDPGQGTPFSGKFNPIPFDPGRGMPTPGKPPFNTQPFNPMPFEGNYDPSPYKGINQLGSFRGGSKDQLFQALLRRAY